MALKPILLAAAFALTAGSAGAVTLKFAGTVTNGLGSLGAGTLLTGSLSYDETAAPRPGGNAFQEVYDALTSFSYTLGSLSGSLVSPGGGPEVQIDNDLAGFSDRFGVVARVADGLTPQGLDGTFALEAFSLRMDDSTFGALSSTALPTSLSLSDFTSSQFFLFMTDRTGALSVIDGTLTLAETVNPIPLPAGLPLLIGALGVFGWTARRRRS